MVSRPGDVAPERFIRYGGRTDAVIRSIALSNVVGSRSQLFWAWYNLAPWLMVLMSFLKSGLSEVIWAALDWSHGL